MTFSIYLIINTVSINIKIKRKGIINSAKDKLTKSNITIKYMFYNLHRSIFCGKGYGKDIK